jgi:hypothetical protein
MTQQMEYWSTTSSSLAPDCAPTAKDAIINEVADDHLMRTLEGRDVGYKTDLRVESHFIADQFLITLEVVGWRIPSLLH